MEDKELEGQEITQETNEEVLTETEEVSADALQEKPVSEEKTEAEEVAKETAKKPKKKQKKVKEEKVEESFEGLSDDEIYTRMQTEKLVQRRKKRKIITAVAMGVAFALALVVIILATVPVSLKPDCIDNNYTEVRFYNSSNINNPSAAILKGDSKFKQFKKVFDKSFAQSCLSGLFGGSLFSYDIEENHIPFTTAINNGLTSGKYIKLSYDKEHKVTRQNGKVYYSNRYENRKWDFAFNEAYIQVKSESGFVDTKIYIPVAYPDSEAGEYAIVITVKANTSKIDKAWSDFVNV